MREMKIGDVVICVKTDTENYIGGEDDNERLILGESYKISDKDSRIPNKICVKLKGPWYFHEEFVPEECFSLLAGIRDEKLNKLGIK